MKKHLLFILIYLLLVVGLTCFYTYPLVTDFNNIIYGFSGDNFGSIWYSWWVKYAASHNLSPDYTYQINYPFGEPLKPEVVEVLWIYPLQWLTNVFNEIMAFNILAFISFPTSALTMFLLSYYLVKNRLVASFAGIAYAFAPYHFWQGYAHISLALIQWLPLYVLSLFYFFDTLEHPSTPRKKVLSSVLFAASLFVVTMTTFYYGYFMILLTIAFSFFKVVYHLVQRLNFLTIHNLKYILLSVVVFSILMSPFILSVVSSKKPVERSYIQRRPINDLLSLSARPWDFLLPAPNHFLFGEQAEKFYKNTITKLTSDYKSHSAFLPERVLYIGFTISLLALIGLIGGLMRKEYKKITLLVFLTLIVTLILSAPPYILVRGITIYTPNYYLYEYLPFFRAYVRLGIVVLMLMLVLCSIGLKILLHNKSKLVSYIIILFSVGLVLFEFSPKVGSSTTDLTKISKAYDFIKNKGDVRIVELPRNFDIPDALIMQTRHNKPFLNPLQEYKRDLFQLVEDPYHLFSTKILSALSIDYILYHTEALYDFEHPIDDLHYTRYANLTLSNKNLKPVFHDKGVYVFEIPKYNTDFAGAIFLEEDGFTWAQTQRELKSNQTGYILPGNFTNKTLKVDLKIEGLDESELEILVPVLDKNNDTYTLILHHGWNKIFMTPKKDTKVEVEITNIYFLEEEDLKKLMTP